MSPHPQHDRAVGVEVLYSGTLLPPLDVSIDGDNPDHILWIFEKATVRADEYGIQGVTYRLTQGKF